MTDRKRLSREKLTWLKEEIVLWKEDGVISEVQADTIVGRYDMDEENAQHGGRVVTVISVLGAILLGVGAILFFASNWQYIDKWFKVVLIIGCIILAYGTGWWFAYEKGSYPKAGMALIFLGTLFYGSGIWLIAQIFHMNSHFPYGVLIWCLGILPIAYVAKSMPVLVESTLLLALWTIMEQGNFNHRNYLFLPVVALILLLSYKMKNKLAVGLSLSALMIWVFMANVGIESPFIALSTAFLGLLIFSLGSNHTVKNVFVEMKLPYRVVGLVSFLFSLYILTFGFVANLLEYSSRLGDPFFYSTIVVLAVGVGVSGIVSVVRGQNGKEKGYIFEGVMVLTGGAVLAILTLTGTVINPNVFIIVTNLLLFAAIIGVVVSGYLNIEPVLINFGLIFFVLNIVTRYFDFFWGTMNRSLFFMGGGVLLLAVGFLIERNRRKILREMRVKAYEA